MDNSEQSSFTSELEKPPTLVAEFGSEKISEGGGSDQATHMIKSSPEDKSAVKMPVLQPNVSGGIGTRTQSGRIRKPARNFNSDEYVVPTLIKRRTPATPKASPVVKEKVKVVSTPPPPAPVLSAASTAASEIHLVRARLEEKFPNATKEEGTEETVYSYIWSICFKGIDMPPDIPIVDIHNKVKIMYITWTKGPYRLKEDEVKFIKECIVKPELTGISLKEWRILAEVLRERATRMSLRFSRPGRCSKKKSEDMKKSFAALGMKIVKGKQSTAVDSDEDYQVDSDDIEGMDEDMSIETTPPPVSRLSTRSKDGHGIKTRGSGRSSKTPSVSNNDEDYDLGPIGIDDFAGEEQMFDDLDSALVKESKDKVGTGNSMVAALHATLQSKKKPEDDPSPPALDKDGAIYRLDDMEGADIENFFELNNEGSSFAEASSSVPSSAVGGEMTDEAFAELEQRILDDEDDSRQSSSSGRRIDVAIKEEKLDLSTLEIEESSGNIKQAGGIAGDGISPGVTMISTKLALMCALKISEDFLPTSHEIYLNRLEGTEKYGQAELNDIRRKFNMKVTTAAKRKIHLNSSDSNSSKKQKVAKSINNESTANERPKSGLPILRSAYARCRKFMEDETTPFEKLGNNKILAAGKVMEVDYENYIKESDVKVPYDESEDQLPKLLPPSVSNCHAPPCRLGCICASISEDMPPRKHCGRPRCFFECTCQQNLLNSTDDGDIRSRLRPRVSLLNWRAESTEKEKEPMTSYRQMERGTHFIRVRRPPPSTDRLRREFVLDGKVVDRVPTKSKGPKERLSNRTKALLQSSHRRMLAKHEPHGLPFVRIVPGKPDVKPKPKVTIEQMQKKCLPMTINVKHLDIDITPVKQQPVAAPPPPRRQSFFVRKEPVPKMSVRDLNEMKSIIQEVVEDVQLFTWDNKVAFFSWSAGVIQPKVIMYQVEKGDQLRIPWIYIPIPPQGYSWICHSLAPNFEKSDYIYIPEIKCTLTTQALRVNMNTAFLRKKGVVFDVKATGNAPGIGKIYFFPDLPKLLICGPFRTDQTTVTVDDPGNAEAICKAADQMEKLRLMKKQNIGNDLAWKTFTKTPTIFPIKKRTDNEIALPPEKSRKLFAQLLPKLMPKMVPISQANVDNSKRKQTIQTITPLPTPKPVFSGGWTGAIKFVGFGQGGTVPNGNMTEFIKLM